MRPACWLEGPASQILYNKLSRVPRCQRWSRSHIHFCTWLGCSAGHLNHENPSCLVLCVDCSALKENEKWNIYCSTQHTTQPIKSQLFHSHKSLVNIIYGLVWGPLSERSSPETKTLPATTGNGKTLANSCRNSWSRRVQTRQLLPQSAAGFGLTEVLAWSLLHCLVAPAKQQRPASTTAGTDCPL